MINFLSTERLPESNRIKIGLTYLRSPVSAIHACVLLHIGDAHFLNLGATFLSLARLFFLSGATFFRWRDFFPLARLFLLWRDFFSFGATLFFWRDFFLFGATFFRWRDFFFLARLFFAGATFFVSLALICRPLLDLLRAQVTNTCSCEQDGGLGGLRSKEGK